jgi:uncharacterized phage protein gp47/JayE
MSDIQANTFGVTPAGFVVKPFAQIMSELDAAAQAIWGAQADLGPDGPIGQMIGNDAIKIFNLWELAQAVFSAFNPNSAEGISLDRVAAMVAVKRNLAMATQVTEALAGTLGTVVPFGNTVSQPTTGNQFTLASAVTIALTSLLTVTLTIGTVSNGHVYTLTVNGNVVSFTAGGADTALTITTALVAAVNALSISLITVTNLGTGAFTLAAQDGTTGFSVSALDAFTLASAYASPGVYNCTQTGPISAPANSVTTINNPVNGLNSVTNPAAGILGTNAESDAAFRVRRMTALFGGDATDAAIGSFIQNNVPGVTFAYCISNRTSFVDALGRPAHSFEVQVIGGANQAIANALWQCMPAGIQPYGNVGPLTVIDSSGNPQIVYFSRPVSRYIWINITTTPDSSGTFPANAGAIIKSAIMNWVQGASPFAAPALPTIGGLMKVVSLYTPILTCPGIETLVVQIAVTSTPAAPGGYGTADIVLTTEQQGVFSTSQILVNGA